MEQNKTNSVKSQKSLYLKIGFILLLILLLMIPNLMIRDLIFERSNRATAVQNEIAQSWGPDQKIIGPILSIPYYEPIPGKDKKILRYKRVLPKDLQIDINVETEERKKSIYSTVLYTSTHDVSSTFDIDFDQIFSNEEIEVQWEDAAINIGFSKIASIVEEVNIRWNDKNYRMLSGTSDNYLEISGIFSEVNIDPEVSTYSLNTTIKVNGSKSLKFIPLADNMVVNMTSKWQSPGFVGLPLPQERKISDNGFTAVWKTSAYNRSFKPTWTDSEVKLNQYSLSGFGVDLVQPIGHYQKNTRTAKYALLIISLSFLVYFFFEVLKNSKVHPVQYIFIGLSLSVFYILLLSFSEHIGFEMAYLVASLSTIGMIVWYSAYVLASKKNVGILGLILIGLYAYIYIILQMEDYALLAGSIGLFVILCTVMFLSRKMDWYKLGAG